MKTPIRYNGPYLFTSGKCIGRRFMTVWYSDGSKGTTLYSRYLMQIHLGRTLDPTETVDHINEDKTDDRIDNFQLLSKSANAAKTARLRKKITWYEFICPQCNKPSKKDARQVRHNAKQNKSGPYCSRQCARYAQAEREGCPEVVCGSNAMYGRGCRCRQCKDAHNLVINEWKRSKKRAPVS
jgi:hypothetical protein